MSNPLLTYQALPPFSDIKIEHILPALQEILTENLAIISELVEQDELSWDSLIEPLTALDDRLERMWQPVSIFNAVLNNPEIREAYNNCLPKLTQYSTQIGQNQRLYQAYVELHSSPAATDFTAAQRKLLEDAIRDFKLAGVALPEDEKQQYAELSQALSKLTSTYNDNVLDATNAWTKLVTDVNELDGLPEVTLNAARARAEQEGQDGWLLTLEMPCYIAVIQHASNQVLRQEIYTAYVTRASDQGPHAGQWDNSKVMADILNKRHAQAKLLGFNNFAEESLATKMADSPEGVIQFLQDLAKRAKPQAAQEFKELQQFAAAQGVSPLQAWDVPYHSEQLRLHKYAVSQEELRPYFQEAKVWEGLFGLINKLFGMRVELETGVDVWHPDAKFYSIYDETNTLRGQFYADLYARPHKQSGAWMGEIINRWQHNSDTQTPVAYLVCNFTPATGDMPCLLTHNEVETLFHEFGHTLHHLLTTVDHPDVAGINGVPWDAVEFPSQFMELWCWQREVIDTITAHYETGATLPDELFDKMLAARHFQSAMQLVRQLEFALFDFRIHAEYSSKTGDRIQETLNEVRGAVAVVPATEFNRFQHSFSHIFGGGYAAGYYSYKWAEVLACDAFAQFEEQGLLKPEVGRQFLNEVLSQGGSKPPLELFVNFRGREPEIDALLRHTGISG